MKQEFLDETDLKLLDALQHDATLSNVALAERLKISPPTCLRRVKRLTDEGWIERQIAVLNADKLGAALGHGLTALALTGVMAVTIVVLRLVLVREQVLARVNARQHHRLAVFFPAQASSMAIGLIHLSILKQSKPW